MLKVIKSNMAFALILLLSIPAYAVKPSTVVNNNTTRSALTGFMHRIYNALPAWSTIKGVVHTGCSKVQTGFTTSLKYLRPLAKKTYALIKKNPKLSAATFATTAALAATYTVWKVRTMMTRNVLKHAKSVAEHDYTILKETKELGKQCAGLNENDPLYVQYQNKWIEFKHAMSKCKVPAAQEELKAKFIETSEKVNALVGPIAHNCVEHEAEIDAMLTELHNIIDAFDQAIAAKKQVTAKPEQSKAAVAQTV